MIIATTVTGWPLSLSVRPPDAPLRLEYTACHCVDCDCTASLPAKQLGGAISGTVSVDCAFRLQ